jgi:hypothetical protein
MHPPSIWDGSQCEAATGRERPPCPEPPRYVVTTDRPPHGTVTQLLCTRHAAWAWAAQDGRVDRLTDD